MSREATDISHGEYRQPTTPPSLPPPTLGCKYGERGQESLTSADQAAPTLRYFSLRPRPRQPKQTTESRFIPPDVTFNFDLNPDQKEINKKETEQRDRGAAAAVEFKYGLLHAQSLNDPLVRDSSPFFFLRLIFAAAVGTNQSTQCISRSAQTELKLPEV